MNLRRDKGWEGERNPHFMLNNPVLSKYVNVNNAQPQKERWLLYFIEKGRETPGIGTNFSVPNSGAVLALVQLESFCADVVNDVS